MALSELATRLSVQITPYNNNDPAWVQYVKDHRSTLMETATVIQIPANIMFTYQYRMATLLNKLGAEGTIAWIVMWLNQLESIADVADLKELIVPSITTVKSLHQAFTSFNLKLSKSQ